MGAGWRIIGIFSGFLLVGSFWASPAHSQESVTGRTFYTAANIWYENPKKILSTNYHRGTILPAGTKVTTSEVEGKKIQFTDANGVGFEIEFVKKHSSDAVDLWAYFRRYFSADDPMRAGGPYQKFSQKEKNAIKAGEIQVGMSKDAVLMAYGYPPAHRTPSLESDQWVYWLNRFVNRPVLFRNGRVSQWQ